MININSSFYHVSCLIFLNLIYIKDSCLCLRGGEKEEELKIFLDTVLDSVVKSEMSTLLCALCDRKFGYKLKCNHPDCNLAFHTHCAYIHGIYFDL